MTIIHQNFQMLQGESRIINIQILDNDNEPLPLGTVDSIEWTLKNSPYSLESIIHKELDEGIDIIDSAEGTITVTLAPSDTEDLEGIFYHNVSISVDGLKSIVLEGGVFIYITYGVPESDYIGELLQTYFIVSNNKVYIMLDEELEPNTEYRVVISDGVLDQSDISLGQEFTYTFSSTYFPLYASFNTVMMDLGLYMSNINEDYVYRYIRENSRAIQAITPRKDVNWNNPPFEFFQYIRFKTIYDMVINSYVRSTGGGGKKVRLGDLDVDKKSASADMATILKKLEDQLQPWYDLCMGLSNRGRAKAKSFVKSGRNNEFGGEYPYPRELK